MAEKKDFNPIKKACADSMKTGWLGDRHFDIKKCGTICHRRGLVGTKMWKQKNLSLPLGLLAKEAKGLTDEIVDALLESFAKLIDVDANLMKRHFYAIKFNYEDQFLADTEKEKLVEEAEDGLETEEFEEE